jgi:hypothetical protein
MPSFGRLPAPDDRDLGYRARSLLDLAPPPTATRRYYRTGPVLDQGPYGICVGAAWRQWLSSALLMTRTGPDMTTIYREAILIDEWTDNDNDATDMQFGTSIRAGAKALKARGHLLTDYRWATTADDVRDWLLAGLGTVVVGTLWTRDMLDPDRHGFIRPTGPGVGGHAYLIVGYSDDRDAFRLVNSWSADWGQGGRAWVRSADLQTLLTYDGEACMAVEDRSP